MMVRVVGRGKLNLYRKLFYTKKNCLCCCNCILLFITNMKKSVSGLIIALFL